MPLLTGAQSILCLAGVIVIIAVSWYRNRGYLVVSGFQARRRALRRARQKPVKWEDIKQQVERDRRTREISHRIFIGTDDGSLTLRERVPFLLTKAWSALWHTFRRKNALSWLIVSIVIAGGTVRLTGFRATAQCRDGSYSWSAHHRGACSGHRGVAKWLRAIPR
jgi:hypothetical protein